MKDKYIFIPANPKVPCSFVDVSTDDGSDPEVNRFNDHVHELISADCYEAVYIFSDLIMLVDESGKLTGKPINIRASQFYAGTTYGDPIVGDVIMCSIKWIDTLMPDGELIRERDFGPLGPIYSAILADQLGIAIPEPA